MPPAAPFPSSRRRDAGLAALLLVATALAYLPALHGGYIIDDAEHVTAPGLRSLAGLWRIWSVVGATHQYYPLLHTAFWLEYRCWGEAVLGYHVVNVLWHATSACLLAVLLRRLAVPGAWLAAFIFALHPVCVESVAWISEQKNTLSTLFYLLAALTYLRSRESPARSSLYFLALGCFAAALLSKTMTVTLPGALLVLAWWRHGRLAWKRDVQPLLPWFALGALAILPTMRLERTFCAPYAADLALSPLARGLLAARVGWFYLAKLAWPVHLTFIYPRWTVDAGQGWQYAFPLGALALVAGLGRLAGRNRGPLAAFLVFAVTLLPVLGFVNAFWFVLSYVGDHLQYLACPALFALFAAGAVTLVHRLPAGARRLAPGLGAALVATLGVLTWRQARIYRDAETLYRATLARNPTCWVAHYNLGNALNEQPDRTPEVIAEWEETLREKPDYVEGQNNLACVLARVPGGAPEAIAHFEAALRLRPDFVEAQSNLASLLAGIPGRAPDAVRHFEAALRLQADFPAAQNGLGNLLVDIPGRLNEGIAHLEEAVRLQPDFAEAHWNLGLALARLPPRRPEAITQIEAALRIDPSIAGGAQALADLRAEIARPAPPG